MALLRRLFLGRVGPDIGSAAIIQPVMTAVGVFTFLAGVLYLPALAPTRVEMIGLLLLLAAVALLRTAVGQLTAVLERLDRREQRSAEPGAAPDVAVTASEFDRQTVEERNEWACRWMTCRCTPSRTTSGC